MEKKSNRKRKEVIEKLKFFLNVYLFHFIVKKVTLSSK